MQRGFDESYGVAGNPGSYFTPKGFVDSRFAPTAQLSPPEAPDKYRKRFAHISDPRRQPFDGMLSAMDDAVGLVLGKLRERKLEERTLVFFISDNGAPGGRDGNGGLRGGKHTCWEGGHGDLKLVPGEADNRPPELFDLAGDIGEKNNLASTQPDKVKELQTLWDQWNAQLAPPSTPKDKALRKEKKKQRRQP